MNGTAVIVAISRAAGQLYLLVRYGCGHRAIVCPDAGSVHGIGDAVDVEFRMAPCGTIGRLHVVNTFE